MPTVLCSLSCTSSVLQVQFRGSPKRGHRSPLRVYAAVKDEQQIYETAFRDSKQRQIVLRHALEIESITATLGRIEAKLDKIVTKDDLTISVKALELKMDNSEKALDLKMDNLEKTLDLKIDNLEKTLSLTFDNKLGTSYRFTTVGFIVLFFSILLSVDPDAHSIFGRLAASLLPRFLPG